MKVFIVLREDYESDGGREFTPNTSVEGVFLDEQAANDFVSKQYGEDDPSEVGYGLEVEEHEAV